jgi:HlyD family secretion protein
LKAAEAVKTAGTGSQADVDAAQKALRWAELSLQQAQADFAADNAYLPAEETVALARAAVKSAELKLKEAQVYYAILQGQEVPVNDLAAAGGAAYFKLEQARLNLESARLAVENMQLTAPFSGTVTKVNATAGQTIGATPILSLATLNELLVRFYVEEADLGKVSPGDRVNFTFEAYPDRIVGGKVLRLEPTLATVDGTAAAVVWAVIDPSDEISLISGMAVDVEVVANESKGALLVPAQALRELAPGSYAVFVVQPDGQLKLTPVAVGLKDFANAEILSGLQAGDVVSTGNVETK